MTTATAPKKLLSNLSLIRPILLVLLVFYNAFAIFGGACATSDGLFMLMFI